MFLEFAFLEMISPPPLIIFTDKSILLEWELEGIKIMSVIEELYL